MNSLRQLSKEAVLYEKQAGGKTLCLACAHRCVTAPGDAGRCGVRFNNNGVLMAPWGYVSGTAADPIEKKPFFHVLPGSGTLSFGMFGCNLKCDFCQNWRISAVRVDTRSGTENLYVPIKTTPQTLTRQAVESGLSTVVSTYNEPLITAEWAAGIFSAAKSAGLRTAFVSNGYATAQAAAYLRSCLDFWKVDLKSFNPKKYRTICGGDLEKAKTGIRIIKESGFWVEAVTLVVPGFNDSIGELGVMAEYLAGLSRDIPWHLTAFHPDHRMKTLPPTAPSVLLRARDLAIKKGLRYVYCGNIPGNEGEAQDTICPACAKKIVQRTGFEINYNLIEKGGLCECGEVIAGVWD